VPHKLAHRLGEYIRQKGREPKERIFSISYPAARMVVKKAGEVVEISLRPHDLRRHAATYASRSGTPMEIVSTGSTVGLSKVRSKKDTAFLSPHLYLGVSTYSCLCLYQ